MIKPSSFHLNEDLSTGTFYAFAPVSFPNRTELFEQPYVPNVTNLCVHLALFQVVFVDEASLQRYTEWVLNLTVYS